MFDSVAKIEKAREGRYLRLLKNVEDGRVFSQEGDKIWQRANCGHMVFGKSAPGVCPVCKDPKAYFRLRSENY